MIVTQIAPFYQPDVPLQKACPENFFSQSFDHPFSDQAVFFLNQLSRSVLAIPGINNYPELVTLAFWLRKSNIRKICTEYQKTLKDNEVLAPRGVAFHVSPSNVDGIFLYSWALSMLSGNLNIIRVSQNRNDQQNLLFGAIQHLMNLEDHQELRKRNIVLTYPHNTAISTFFTKRSDVRILWGGDETIQLFRSLPAQPTTKDIPFADKFSYCIVHTNAYNIVSEEQATDIARLFYNDAYWFDQMACSSPRIVYFVGDTKECQTASQRFWKKLTEELRQHSRVDTISSAMNKLIFLHRFVSEGMPISPLSSFEHDKPTVVHVATDHKLGMETHCGDGFFFESFLDDLALLAPLVQAKDQTLTYFGFDKKTLREFVGTLGKKGLNRIVPIGQALDFSTTWDGHVLLTELTQRISVL